MVSQRRRSARDLPSSGAAKQLTLPSLIPDRVAKLPLFQSGMRHRRNRRTALAQANGEIRVVVHLLVTSTDYGGERLITF
jgi:hypothetical protein